MQEFLIANYHAHTWRCQHAYGTEREYIEAAIAMGIKEFGFSDHIPFPETGGYVSSIRMKMEQAPEYVGTIRALGREYKDDIRIYVGFEAEYVPGFYEEQMRMFHAFDCDYLILGQHFLKSEEQGPYTGTETEDEGRIREYVDIIIEGMKTGSFLYLAHPDLMNYQGMDSVYDWEMTRLCREMKELGIPLEMNMLGMTYDRIYPAERFWKIAGEVQNEVVLGLDAHCLEDVVNTGTYHKCMELVNKYNLNLIKRIPLDKTEDAAGTKKDTETDIK